MEQEQGCGLGVGVGLLLIEMVLLALFMPLVGLPLGLIAADRVARRRPGEFAARQGQGQGRDLTPPRCYGAKSSICS